MFVSRNFEKNHVGKIKTVYPSAYQFRQEKGLKNAAGFKEPGYQLTVEARLEDGKSLSSFNPLPHMAILGSSKLAANKDMMSTRWTNGKNNYLIQ